MTSNYHKSRKNTAQGRSDPGRPAHGSTMRLISLAHEIDVEPRASKVERVADQRHLLAIVFPPDWPSQILSNIRFYESRFIGVFFAPPIVAVTKPWIANLHR